MPVVAVVPLAGSWGESEVLAVRRNGARGLRYHSSCRPTSVPYSDGQSPHRLRSFRTPASTALPVLWGAQTLSAPRGRLVRPRRVAAVLRRGDGADRRRTARRRK